MIRYFPNFIKIMKFQLCKINKTTKKKHKEKHIKTHYNFLKTNNKGKRSKWREKYPLHIER